jgi:serine/threonine protein kinase
MWELSANSSIQFHFIDETRVYIICEYINELDLYIVQEKHMAKWAHQFLLGIQHCHEQRVICRDIKPENILISNINDSATLIDFGYAICEQCKTDQTVVSFVDYICPMQATCLLNNSTHLAQPYSYASDMGSFGAVLFEMFTGHPPFDSPSFKDTFWRIEQGQCT